METEEASSIGEEWRAVLDGDRTAFNRMVEPLVDELLRAAERDVRHYRKRGNLNPGSLKPAELVGETLLGAWTSRRQKPSSMSLKSWLLGLQQRVLRKLIDADHLERTLWSVSLEEAVPPPPLFDDDSLWEWYQPDDITLWEDVIPSDFTADDRLVGVDENSLESLGPTERQAFLLYDRHELSLAEVATILDRTVRETADMITKARRTLA